MLSHSQPRTDAGRAPAAAAAPARSMRGSVLPFVAFSLILIAGYVGFSLDVMRNVLTVRQLQFAAQSAALYALSYAVDADGSMSPATVQGNIASRVLYAGGAAGQAFNEAGAGPSRENPTFRSPVTFSSADVAFALNPQDPGDIVLQVRARRDGADALNLFFLPALYAMDLLSGASPPQQALTVSPYRTAEVCGQPAGRVGEGAPRNAQPGTRAYDLLGFAALPIAISNAQFAQAANPAAQTSDYLLDLVSSSSPGYSAAPAPGHIKAAFVNLAHTGVSPQYYGAASGAVAIDELRRLLAYFQPLPAVLPLSPGVVERGSALSGFDPADSLFQSRLAEIAAELARLPVNRTYIFPVVRSDPDFQTTMEVVGFARLTLLSTVDPATGSPAIAVRLAESAPVRNASVAAGRRTTVPGQTFAPPVYPFGDRRMTGAGAGIEIRPRGVVLAPAISPRLLSRVN